MEKEIVTIHTYYHQHDVYEIPRVDWERELIAHGGDTDDAFLCFVERGIDPADGESLDFYMEIEK